MASVEQIGIAKDRNIARNVLSSLVANSGSENIQQLDNIVVQAYAMLKNSGQDISELKIKEAISSIVNSDSGGSGSYQQGAVNTVPRNAGSIVANNQEDLSYGEGVAPGPSREYGHLRDMMSQIDPNAGLGEKAIDLAGTLTWNFLNSLSIGLLGLADEKIVRPIVGEQSGYAHFMEGMKEIDTSWGKTGEVAGTMASFLVPGGALTGGAKLAGLGKANLLARTFGTGRQATKALNAGVREAGELGAKGVVSSAGAIAEKVEKIKGVVTEAKAVSRLKKAEDLGAELAVKGRRVSITEPLGGPKTETFKKGLEDIVDRSKKVEELAQKAGTRIEELEKVSAGTIDDIARRGVRKSIEDLSNIRRTMKASTIDKVGVSGMSDVVKARFRSNVYGKILKEVGGDKELAETIVNRAVGNIDEAIEYAMKNGRSWGEVFASKIPVAKGFSDRVGKIAQNTFEEAIGFAAHTMMYGSINRLAADEEMSIESLTRAAKESASEVPHSLRTAFIFATGGGIALPGVGTQFGFAPLKLIFAGREKSMGEVLAHASGRIGVDANTLNGGLFGAFNRMVGVQKEASLSRIGIGGERASTGFFKRLRQRGIVDYHKLGNENPQSLEFVGRNVLKYMKNQGENASGITSGVQPGTLENLLGKLNEQIASGKVEHGAGSPASKIAQMLEGMAKNGVEQNNAFVVKSFGKDLGKTFATAASIAYSGGDLPAMIEGVENGDVHLADLISHLGFSLMSATHPIIKTHGNLVAVDKDIKMPDVFYEEQQLKAAMRTIGLDVGEPILHSVIKNRENNLLGDTTHEQVRAIMEVPKNITEAEIAGHEVIADGAAGNWQTSATMSEVAEVFRWYKRRNVEFTGDLEFLNKFFAKEKVSESDLDDPMATKALAALVTRIKKNMFESGIYNGDAIANLKLTSDTITRSMFDYMSGVVRDADIITSDFAETIRNVIGERSPDIGRINFKAGVIERAFEELGDKVTLDINDVRSIADNILDVNYVFKRVTRADKNVNIDDVERAKEIILSMDRIQSKMQRRFGSNVTFAKKGIIFDVLDAIEGSHADSVKRIMTGELKVGVDFDGVYNEVGVEHLISAAQDIGIISRARGTNKGTHYVLNYIDDQTIDTNKINAWDYEFVSNLIRIMRNAPNVKSEGGEAIGHGTFSSIRNEIKLTLDGAERTVDGGIRALANKMGLALDNPEAVSNIVRQLQSHKFSKISVKNYSVYEMLREAGLIYYDPKRGDVVANIAGELEQMMASQAGPEQQNILKQLLVARGTETGRDNIDIALRDMLQPHIDALIEAGLVSGWGDPNTIAVYGRGAALEAQVDRMINMIDAFEMMESNQSRDAVKGLLSALTNYSEFSELPEGVSRGKIEMVTGHIVRLMGGDPTVRDWANLRKILSGFGMLDGKFSKNKFENALKKAEELVYEETFVDSVIDRFKKSGFSDKLADEYEPLLGDTKESGYNIAKVASQFGLTNEQTRALVKDIKKIADSGKNIEDSMAEIRVALGSTGKIPVDGVSDAGILGIYNRAKMTDRVRVIKIGDYSKISVKTIASEQGDIVKASVMVEDKPISKGLVTDFRDVLGLEVSLLDGMAEFNGNPTSFFKSHDTPLDAALVEHIEKIEQGNYSYLEESPNIKGDYRKGVAKNRSAVLAFGDLKNFMVVHLPGDPVTAKEFAAKLRALEAEFAPYIKHDRANNTTIAFRKMKELAESLESAPTADDVNKAYSNLNNIKEVLYFIRLAKMVGPKEIPSIDKAYADNVTEKQFLSRFRQMNSRSFIATDSGAFEKATEAVLRELNQTSAHGRNADGTLNAILIDEVPESLRDLLPQGPVTRADGQVFFARWVLGAQSMVNGYEPNTLPGVIKNMIIADMGGSTLMTKNAGATTPELERFMKDHNIAMIITPGAAKFKAGQKSMVVGEDGKDIGIDGIANGKKVVSVDGVFKIKPESLRFNKMPHKTKATLGFQIENKVSAKVVDAIRNGYFATMSGENSTPYGVNQLFQELFANSPQSRAKARAFVLNAYRESAIESASDLSMTEMSDADISTMYLMSSEMASPMDLWFKDRTLGVAKKRILGNSVFRVKEGSGRQDILAADTKNILDTMEAVASNSSRDIVMVDNFKGDGEGIMFAFDIGANRAAEDAAEFFGYSKDFNFFNSMLKGSSNERYQGLQQKLLEGKYAFRRLYRMKDGRKGNKDSFIYDMIMHNIESGNKKGIFAGIKNKDDALFVNDFVIDLITRRDPGDAAINRFIEIAKKAGVEKNVEEAFNLLAEGDVAADGEYSLGYVHDVISSIFGKYDYHSRVRGTEEGKSSSAWGIAGMNQRYPSARINDTLPTVFLGFADKSMGNQVILNYYDAVLKGEADYDIDNYNTWFRFPTEHIASAVQRRSIIGMADPSSPVKMSDVTGGREKFNPFDHQHNVAYARNAARAEYLRGAVIKDDSLVEKLLKDQYKITFTANGKRYIIEPKFASIDDALNSAEGVESFYQASTMVQEVIDSKGGLLPPMYGDGFDAFSVFARNFFHVREVTPTGKEGPVALADDHVNMLKRVSSPYRQLLTFSKQSWTGDNSESMSWPDMRDILIGYSKIFEPGKAAENVTELLRSSLNDKMYSDVLVEFTHNRTLAEYSIPTVLNADKIANKGDTSWIYGKEATELSALAQKLVSAAGGTGTDDAKDQLMADIIATANTDNFNVRNALRKISGIRSQLVFAQKQAAKGNKFQQMRVNELRQQLRDLLAVDRAYYKALDRRQDVMSKNMSRQEYADVFHNTESVESIRLALSRAKVPTEVLNAMIADARKIQALRGRLWYQELAGISSKDGYVYDEMREKELVEEVTKYMDRYYANADFIAPYDQNAAIYALIYPQAESAYSGSMGRRFIKYKKVPSDLMNIVFRYYLKNSPDSIKSALKGLSEASAVTSAYMEGRSHELRTILDKLDLSSDQTNFIGLSERINMRSNTKVNRYSLLRNLGMMEDDISEVSFEGKINGIPINRMVKMAEQQNPENLTEYVTMVGRSRTRPSTKDNLLFGKIHGDLEIPEFVRVTFEDGRFDYDENGFAIAEARKRVRKQIDKMEVKPDKKRTEFMVLKEADNVTAEMVKLIRSARLDPISSRPNGIESFEALFRDHSANEAAKGCM